MWLGKEDCTAVVAVGDGAARLSEGVGGGGDLDVAGGAAALVRHVDDGIAFAFVKEASVGVHEIFVVDLGDLVFPVGFGFSEFGFARGGARFELGNFFVDEALGLGEGDLGFGDVGAEAVGDLHELKFAGLEFVDLSFVAYHFNAEFGVFLVFLGLELLDLQAIDGIATSANVEFNILDCDFVRLIIRLGGCQSLGVIGEAFLGRFLE